MKENGKKTDNLNKTCFPKKLFYIALHLPLIGLFAVLGFYIYSFGLKFLLFYILFGLISIIFQSYCCAYQNCPYVGFKSFCPGIGGFLILSSYIAVFLKKAPKSKFWFNLCASIGGLSAFVFVVYPVFFLIKLNLLYLILYILVSIIYVCSFFYLICPGCAIAATTCPGGVFYRRTLRKDEK